MAKAPEPPERALDSALLLLSREPKQLAALFEALLPREQIQAWAQASGKRRAGRPQPALQLAEVIAVHHKLRAQVAAGVQKALPEADDSDSPWAELARELRGPELSDWEAALARMEDPEWCWPAAPKPARATQKAQQSGAAALQQAAEADAPAAPAPTGRQARIQSLQEQLKAARQEAAALQEELGQERRKRQAEDQERSAARAAAEAERQRATELKQQLAASNSASDRENALEAEMRELRQQVHILGQKVQWLEEERDDLRGVLADHDRFDELPDEEIPSFRDRPLTQLETELAAALEERKAAGGPAFRVLVVGGGQPQHRHQDKLVEYAEVMGFQAHWRMAEYQAWHRALDGLRRDMQDRFDALIILHWNRTTFTRKAREICDSGGAKPGLTCHYEGFTNLRESLQECLRELLAGAERGEQS